MATAEERRARRAARSPANAERGEHTLELAGTPYRLRPSHAAIVAIEEETGRSLLELLRLANTGALPLPDLGAVVAELVRAGAAADDALTRAVHAERMSELAFEEGLHRVLARVTLCLIDAASGGRTAAGEAKAAPATSTGDAGAA